MLGETPQDEVRGGSPRSRGKRSIPRSPHPLNKSLETESSTILLYSLRRSVCRHKKRQGRTLSFLLFDCDDFYVDFSAWCRDFDLVTNNMSN
ncbi:hypothetical protein DYE48_04085 [Halobacillus trueperi]|uniref:Uncharacterized protein n=1 Tax=Halobacillus trueperi TaxID=156205 RepID=A0A3E0JCK3_9BACI|nr:hypothetical protein DYE48_04085 [Halobacillus trueperi]